MTFADFYREHAGDLALRALSQRVPGLDVDDVASEMAACMWRAWKTHDPEKGTFGPYWWSVWLNRRNDLITAALRKKRPRLVLTDRVRDRGYDTELPPEPPPGSSDEESLIWMLLAAGEPHTEVMKAVGWHRNRYYRLLRDWRTPEVRQDLTATYLRRSDRVD